jgi:hypothetical protein
MAKKTTKKNPPPTPPLPVVARPIEIPLPFDTVLAGGAYRVMLPTLGQLEEFWRANRDRFKFAAHGVGDENGEDFMRKYEWIFAPTTQALVKAVYRWDEWGIRTVWYDWATAEPEDHDGFHWEMESDRESRIAHGEWTPEDAAEFRSRTRETYRGWWKLENLPVLDESDWFGTYIEELLDKNADPAEVTAKLQDQTFWAHKQWLGCYEIDFRTPDEVDDMIGWEREWRDAQLERGGCGFYGCENEPASVCGGCSEFTDGACPSRVTPARGGESPRAGGGTRP